MKRMQYTKEETKRFMLCVMMSQSQHQSLCDKKSIADLYLFGYTSDDVLRFSLAIAHCLRLDVIATKREPSFCAEVFLNECALEERDDVTELEAMRVLFALFNVSLFDTLVYVYSVIDSTKDSEFND
jgi:hypothetical protein